MMDPNSGRIVTEDQLEYLRRSDPERAAKFSVRLEGPAEDVQKIADAVQFSAAQRAKNRAKNKAARKARRAGR